MPVRKLAYFRGITVDYGRSLIKVFINMFRLSHLDFEKVTLFLEEVYAQTDSAKLPDTMLEGLERLIPCIHSGYNEINNKTNKVILVMRPFIECIVELTPALEPHFSEHPQLQHYRQSKDRGAYQTSDFVSEREFRDMGIYREFYRHADTLHQLAFLLSAWGDECDIGICINRKERGFSERDRAVTEIVRPHLIQARRNALAFTRAEQRTQSLIGTLDAMNSGMVDLNEDGQVVWLTPRAVELLERFFPGSMKRPSRLPDALENFWRARREEQKTTLIAAIPPEPYHAQIENARLTVRFQAGMGGSSRLLLCEESDLLLHNHARNCGLTKREAEILHWISEGKSNPEISVILSISPRTTHKHVEHIFAKLNVESRHAAALKAIQWRGQVA